ncbi:conserved membrane hypothetical protein [Arthrobacter sp. 9AX]|uniref:hypothetical protein n=1 Tax=Arthrobacter sp. 9AX TaxID=2653131 RepID=UPI0012F2FE73|nr:hypothetical protein [Arthrobacter sp. 9AX]VXC21867.1 conserved membrane hypothetical protein [Arthrobacter sp. 9AX]
MGERDIFRRASWVLIALLTLVAAGTGVASPAVYNGLVEEPYLPGAYSQDGMSVAAALALLVLALTRKASRPRLELIVLGLLGYLVYAYGIYTIERVYNWLYLVYMTIFAAALWAVVYETVALCRRTVQVSLPRGVRLLSASGALLQPVMFYPLWIAMLLPLMAARQKIESIYSVFILDLCLIMPAFLILAIAAMRGQKTGLLLLPAAYVLGFSLILSLAAAEPAKEVFGSRFDPVAFWLWLALSLFFLVLGSLHLRLLRVTTTVPARGPVMAGENQ